jgi:hypothetical protein
MVRAMNDLNLLILVALIKNPEQDKETDKESDKKYDKRITHFRLFSFTKGFL